MADYCESWCVTGVRGRQLHLCTDASGPRCFGRARTQSALRARSVCVKQRAGTSSAREPQLGGAPSRGRARALTVQAGKRASERHSSQCRRALERKLNSCVCVCVWGNVNHFCYTQLPKAPTALSFSRPELDETRSIVRPPSSVLYRRLVPIRKPIALPSSWRRLIISRLARIHLLP